MVLVVLIEKTLGVVQFVWEIKKRVGGRGGGGRRTRVIYFIIRVPKYLVYMFTETCIDIVSREPPR